MINVSGICARAESEKGVMLVKLPDAVATIETWTWRGTALSLMH